MFVTGFRGNQPGRVENGAVAIPPQFNLRGDVVLTVLHARSIAVFPSSVFDEMCKTLVADNEMGLYYRVKYFYCRQHVGADGVLRIPERLLEFAEINGDVAVVGCINHLDILSATRFAAALADTSGNEPAPLP